MPNDHTMLLIRIGDWDAAISAYPVAAELDDGSHFGGGALHLQSEKLLDLEREPSVCGRTLFDALFAGDMRRAYDTAQGRARSVTGGRLRVLLHIVSNAARLHDLAWEQLYIPSHDDQWLPLATSALTPFARYTHLELPDPTPIVERPLRLLAVVANPTDLPGGAAPLDVDTQVRVLYQALGDLHAADWLRVTVLPGHTGLSDALRADLERSGYRVIEGAASLNHMLRQLPDYHVLHFDGHGSFGRRGTDQAALYLERDDGTLHITKDQEIVDRLAAQGRLPHLVFLSACRSAQRDPTVPHPFTGLGARLVQAGIPAVIAMRRDVPISLAQDLTGEFYRRLAEHGVVDLALNQARAVVFHPGATDWALPVLFTRLKAARLFAAAPMPLAAAAESPYKGLLYFDEADADLFFGRERWTARLVERLTRPEGADRFLAVVGASGSGKSSLVRAGVIPKLQQLCPRWPVHVITPTARPLEALAVSLTRHAESVTAAATLIDDLQRHPRSLRLYARRLMSEHSDERLLLVVDQFEELFTQCRDAAERQAFVDNLMTATAPEFDGPVVVLVVLRADFYAHCADYAILRETLAKQQEYIGPLNTDELRQAIEGPARHAGLELEPGLADRLLRDVGGEPGALPLLSHALLETWQRRRGRTLTLQGYAASGGVSGALAQTADAIYKQLAPEQQAIMRHIFLQLTELGEVSGDGLPAPDTRRRVAVRDLAPHPDETEPTAVVLEMLVKARLVTVSAPAGTAATPAPDGADVTRTAEVAHEALIREWPALRAWLDENRASIRLRRQLTRDAKEWARMSRDEGLLYRGARLTALETSAVSQIPEVCQAFLAASRALQAREVHAARTRRAIFATGVLLIVTILAFAALIFRGQAQRNAEIARIATSRRLAAQSLAFIDQQFDLALLLGVEASRSVDLAAGRNSLLTVLQSNPHLRTFLRCHRGGVQSVAFSPDRRTLASGSGDSTGVLWDVSDPHAPAQIGAPLEGHTDGVESIAFSPDGQTLASGSLDNTVILWDVSDPHAPTQIGAPLEGHTDDVESIAFSLDGRTLASGSRDETVILWDVSDPHAPAQIGAPLEGHTGIVLSIAFSPDGRTLASGSWASKSWDRTVILWDISDPRAPAQLGAAQLGAPLQGRVDMVWSIAFSPDGQTLASGSFDNTVILWDVSDPHAPAQIGAPLEGHISSVSSVAFSPDGRTLASGSWDATIILWDVSDPRAPAQIGAPLRGHTSSVHSVVFSPDGRTLASGSVDSTVILWNVSDPRAPVQIGVPLQRYTSFVYGIAFSPDGQTLASGSVDRTVTLWDVSDPHVPAQIGTPLEGHTNTVWSVAFSPDGQTLASGSADRTVILWDVSDPRSPAQIGVPLEGHTDGVGSIAFSPDGRMLASGSMDSTVILWDVSDPRAPAQIGAPLRGHMDGVESIAFSPDGRTLASGSMDSTVILWNVSDPRAPAQIGAPLEGHTSWVWTVAFSPDGHTLASGGVDSTVILWNVSDPRAPAQIGVPLQRHTSSVSSVAFSPDGRTLTSGSVDSTIILWDVSLESWQAQACRIANRDLTQEEWQRYMGDTPYRATCPELPAGE